MRKLFLIPVAALLFACEEKPKTSSDLDLEDFEQRISYALGADMAASFSNVPEDVLAQLSKEEIEKGFYDLLSAEDSENTDDCREVLKGALSKPEGIDTTKNSTLEISHCYGSLFGEMLRSSLSNKGAMKEIDLDIARIGFRSGLNQEDTLIPLEERQEMIANFNNDMSKIAGETFITEKSDEYPENIEDEGYILIEESKGDGKSIDLTMEYKIKYTLTNLVGDTIISTIQDPKGSDVDNAQVVNANDIVFPEGWKLATDVMKVGGEYTLYVPYDLAFGEKGLPRPQGQGYVVQPFSAVIVHSKVIGQYPLNFLVKERGEKVIEEAKQLPNTKVDESGYVITTLEEGDGPGVPEGSDVQAHYILKNSNGEMVENSYMSSMQRNQPAPTFSLNGVVKGWKMAVPEMKKGGRYQLVLPYELAYGEQGNQGIQPYETLTFEMEILDFGKPGSLVQPKPQQQQFSQEQMKQLQQQMQQQQQQGGQN
jgi:FKBP-type peptidyl-prolyl cis-trans isomerase